MVCGYADEPESKITEIKGQMLEKADKMEELLKQVAGSCEQHELCDDDFDSDLQEQIKIYPAFTG